jgi:hypothetical protein
MTDSVSAFHRARTIECKEKIENAACFFKVMNSLDYSQKYKRLNSECPTIKQVKTYKPVGCFLNENIFSDSLSKSDYIIVNDSSIFNNEYCVDYCLSLFSYSYAVFSKESKQCFCLFNLTDQVIDDLNSAQPKMECVYSVYKTGRLSK